LASFSYAVPEFSEIVGDFPNLQLVADGFVYPDGPVYFDGGKGTGYLFVSDFSQDTVFVLIYNVPHGFTSPLVYRKPAAFPAGQTATAHGQLLTCLSTGRAILATTQVGATERLVEAYDSKKLNSPNDVVEKSDGSVWFTDPNYSSLEFANFPADLPNNVYRYDPSTKELTVVASPKEAKLVSPNGLAFSPDEKRLYIADSAAEQGFGTNYEYLPQAVRVYDVTPDGKSLELPGREFFVARSGYPDGIQVDSRGNVYITTAAGVEVLDKEGRRLGTIGTPEGASNLTFGGPDNNILFIAAGKSLWGVQLKTTGAQPVRPLGFELQLPPFFHDSKTSL